MSYNLTYTTQVAGAHTYSKCVGEVLLSFKVRKDTLVMPERPVMSLQFKTLIVQLIKTPCGRAGFVPARSTGIH